MACCLLINSPRFGLRKTVQVRPFFFPSGLLSVASHLRRCGHRAEILCLDPPLGSSKINLGSICGVITSAMRRVGCSIVGVSALTGQYFSALKILETCKRIQPHIITVLGGPHASYRDAECFTEAPYLDAVVRGEGEWTMAEMAKRLDSGAGFDGVGGVTFRRGSEIVRNPCRAGGDIGELPDIDYDLLHPEYLKGWDGFMWIMASRGCNYRCAYCVEGIYWGDGVRRRPVERIVAEIRLLHERYGISVIAFEDSMLEMSSPYFTQLCEALRRQAWPITFAFLTRVDSVSEEGFDRAARAGFKVVMYGIESLSPRVQRMMNKNITKDRVFEACEMAKRRGMLVKTFWMTGHPGDNPQESEISKDGLFELGRRGLIDHADIFTFVPLPGTRFLKAPEAFDMRLLTQDWDAYDYLGDPVHELRDFSKAEIIKCRDELRSAFLRGSASARRKTNHSNAQLDRLTTLM